MVNMPAAVFDMYIVPIVGRIGWPFTSIHSSTFGTEWTNVLDHQSLETIANLLWHRRDLPFSKIRFLPNSQSIISRLRGCHLYGQPDPLSRISDGRMRFFKFRQFSAQHGRIPAPAVLMFDSGAYRILDGNHRVAALASLPNASILMLDCWIGHKGKPL